MTSEVEIEVTSQKGVNARAQELKEKANQRKNISDTWQEKT